MKSEVTGMVNDDDQFVQLTMLILTGSITGQGGCTCPSSWPEVQTSRAPSPP